MMATKAIFLLVVCLCGMAAGAGFASFAAQGAGLAFLIGLGAAPASLIVGLAASQPVWLREAVQRLFRMAGDIRHGRDAMDALRDHFHDFTENPWRNAWVFPLASFAVFIAAGAAIGSASPNMAVPTATFIWAGAGLVYGEVVRQFARVGAIPTPRYGYSA